jgi:DNA-directed RNA polymerase specialized sigma24 family protein
MLADHVQVDSFTEFVKVNETRLRRALTAAFGVEAGREAAGDALVYGWQHWARISGMDNPAGYLYRVGFRTAQKAKPRNVRAEFDAIASQIPWVEPGLGEAFASLSEQQRSVVALLHAYEWSFGEVAHLLGISKASVQTHERRAMKRLRTRLGVTG